MSVGSPRPTLLFISPRFLLPVDSGGKVRTTQILRGLKQLGHFHIDLIFPASPGQVERYEAELGELCDEFTAWPTLEHNGPVGRLLWLIQRASFLLSELPIPVRSDASAPAKKLVNQKLASQPDVVVFDFLHAAVLAPPAAIGPPSVLFTHNVEAEIFQRHIDVAKTAAHRWLWKNQHRKMIAFEKRTSRSFDTLVAVSQRDADMFTELHGVTHTHVIPTGVDIDSYDYTESPGRKIVFCGSMDWLANRDGVEFFLDEVWAQIIARVPEATMTVVGRAPPNDLVQKAERAGVNWHFTGFVDDVRDHIQDATVAVIPLRVGGGTRLKVFEAMALGSAIVSTTLGVEGLEVEDHTHYRRADDAKSMADAVVELLTDDGRYLRQVRNARKYVVEKCSFLNAARIFQEGCVETIERRGLAPVGADVIKQERGT